MTDDYERFTPPRADEEIYQSHVSTFVMGLDPEDGLPAPVTTQNLDKSPGLSEETLICMADKRSFVIRGHGGALLATFTPSEVLRTEEGDYYVGESLAEERLRALGSSFTVPFNYQGAKVYDVEPIRPECKHYLRNLTDIAANRESNFYQRACMAQKSEEGEYYSLRDTRVNACSIRSPRHLASEALMDAFDDKLMREAKTAREMEDFDIDRALAAEKGKLGVLG